MDFVVDSGVKGLKTELEEQTGVPADRMKLMAKSKGAFAVSTERTIIICSESHFAILCAQVFGKAC